MKAFFTVCAMLFFTFGISQNVQPIAEEISSNVYIVSYFHDNGKVSHQGKNIDGKNNGVWQSYDENGKLIAIGEFVNGKKTGVWKFYTNNEVNEVLYVENLITEVKKLQKTALVVKD